MGLHWEKKILRWADRAIIMQAHKQHYKQHSKKLDFAQKLVVLDIPLLQISSNKSVKKLIKNSKLHVVYVGSIKENVRDPHYILKVSEHLSANIIFDFYGTTDCASLFESYAGEGKVVLHG